MYNETVDGNTSTVHSLSVSGPKLHFSNWFCCWDRAESFISLPGILVSNFCPPSIHAIQIHTLAHYTYRYPFQVIKKVVLKKAKQVEKKVVYSCKLRRGLQVGPRVATNSAAFNMKKAKIAGIHTSNCWPVRLVTQFRGCLRYNCLLFYV